MSDFDKYRRLGDYHWREYAKPTIYRDYVSGLRDWVKETNILDVGAGDGLISHLLGARGVELDPIAVALARQHGCDVVKGDAGALPFQAGSFDAVFFGDVIEHLPDPLPALREAFRVLVPTGKLYVTTPPAHDPPRRYHYREYTPDTLAAAVEPIGFVLSAPMFARHDRIHAVFAKVDHVVR